MGLYELKKKYLKSNRYFLIELNSGESWIYFQREKFLPAIRAYQKNVDAERWLKTHEVEKKPVKELLKIWKQSADVRVFIEMNEEDLAEYMNEHFDEFM